MSSEFWAAITGALVGGIVSAGLQWLAHRAAASERRSAALAIAQAHARGMLFKVVKIQSDFQQFAHHFKTMKENAEAHAASLDWKMCLPLANLPREIQFTAEEMSALLATKDSDLFNDVVSIDHVHSGIIQNLTTYRDKREELENMLPAQMDGQMGTIWLDESLRSRAEPRAAKLDGLLGQIIDSVVSMYDQDMALTARVAAALDQSYSIGITTKLKQDS